jgi:mRNA-degrading endonuclease toxin of MazEF toxin-antitoxin module
VIPLAAGGIYYVKDEHLTLPPDDDREMHDERRPVLILSGSKTNDDDEWRTVVCCPISSSTSRKTAYCVPIAYGEANMTKKCWIRVPAIQPLMKNQLEDYIGAVDGEKLKLVHLRLVQYMGLG